MHYFILQTSDLHYLHCVNIQIKLFKGKGRTLANTHTHMQTQTHLPHSMILKQPAGQGHFHCVPHADCLSRTMDQVLSQQRVPAGLTVPPGQTHLMHTYIGKQKWEYSGIVKYMFKASQLKHFNTHHIFST